MNLLRFNLWHFLWILLILTEAWFTRRNETIIELPKMPPTQEMEFLCTNKGVLSLGRSYKRSMYSVTMVSEERDEIDKLNTKWRHAGYRNFILWHHGKLGEGNSVVIPGCCVRKLGTSIQIHTINIRVLSFIQVYCTVMMTSMS
ncbi:uncharacterized protein LOC144348131 [Saccoglossus kowalevskii]